MKKMEEINTKETLECAIRVLSAFPAGISTGAVLKSLTAVLGIFIAGTVKDIYNDEMYENLVDIIKSFAQDEGGREIFNSAFRKV